MWRSKLLLVATDGATNMTGRSRGVVSILESNIQNKTYSIWCGAHRLDLIIQDEVSKNLRESIYQQLTTFISFLLCKVNFCTDVGGQCPKVATKRWLSLGRLCKWIIRKRPTIIEIFGDDRHHRANIPEAQWWL